MHFLPREIEEYADAHTEPEPPLLYELRRATHLQAMYPRMLSSHLQGRLLSLLSKLIQPHTIVEVGTYTGYSALCLAEGLHPEGVLHTLERDVELAAFAGRWFAQAGVDSRIRQHVGDARQMVTALQTEHPIDLLFLDADKESYAHYYETLLPRMRPGGLILTDNVLWSGQVVDKSLTNRTTEALRSFNTCIANDNRVDRVLLPVRDGIYLLRKR